MMKELGIPLLRFTETDIKKNIKSVEEKINELIT